MPCTIEKDFIYVDLSKDQAEKLAAVWNQKRNMWRLPRNYWTLKELTRYDFPLASDSIVMEKHMNQFLMMKNVKDSPGDRRLRPYQRVDVNFLSSLPHAGVFSEQRTGKTVVALTAFEEEGRKKNLIVCPASLVLNWAKEVSMWSDKKPFPVVGPKKQREKIYQEFKESDTGYLIISKDTLKRDVSIIESM